MYRLFKKAMLWELIPLERNPMGLVELKGVSKRLKPPRIFDGGGIWNAAQSARPSLSLYGPSGRVHGPPYQRSDGPALTSKA